MSFVVHSTGLLMTHQIPLLLSAQFGKMLLCSDYRATTMSIVAPLGQCCRLSDDVVCRMLSLDRNLTPTHSNCARRTRLCSHPSCKTRCHFVSWCFPEIMVNFSHLHIHIRWERFRPGFPGCSSRDSSVRVRLSKDAQ